MREHKHVYEVSMKVTCFPFWCFLYAQNLFVKKKKDTQA